MQEYVELRIAQAQVAQFQLAEKARKLGMSEPDGAGSGFELKAEDRSDESEWRRAGPCLRRAGDRIEGRAMLRLAANAAKELRQTSEVHVGRRIEKRFHDAQRP